MAYSPYKMKGHTLPGIKQRTSPAKKELVGDQHNLPAELKAKIEAAPTKMYGKESPAKNYKNPQDYKVFNMGNEPTPVKMYGKKSPAKKYKSDSQRKAIHASKAEKSPAKIAPLVAMAGKALAGKVAGKAADKLMGGDSPAKIIPGLGKTKYMDKIKAFGKAIATGATATDQGINKAIRTYKSEKKKARDSYKA